MEPPARGYAADPPRESGRPWERPGGRPDAAADVAPVSAAEVLLLASVFVIAACGLVYELSAGALASYLLGDSVLQFSTIIGAYLAAINRVQQALIDYNDAPVLEDALFILYRSYDALDMAQLRDVG